MTDRIWAVPRVVVQTGDRVVPQTARPTSGPWAGLLAVRDSKDTSGPALFFASSAWEGFIDALR